MWELSFIWDYITFESTLKWAIAYFFIIWIAILAWVVKDISNRTQSIALQILAVLIILLGTPFGIFIYLLIRPGKTLFEKYYEEIEDNLNTFSAMIDDKAEKIADGIHCPECSGMVSHDFEFCPKCRFDLKHECHTCEKEVFKMWDNCPYCWEKQEAKKSHKNKKENNKKENNKKEHSKKEKTK